MGSSEVVLLNYMPSPFAARVRIALAEKEVEFETREEDLISGKSPLLLRMNPVHTKVPVLIHNGKPICESLIIVEYIDEVWNHKSPLLPSEPHHRAHAKFWADYIDKKVFAAGTTLWLSKEGEMKEAAKKELIDYFKVLEEELGEKDYFGGESFGFVDLVLIPVYSFFHTYETLGNLSIEAKCLKLVAWAKKCLQRTSVSNSLYDQYKVYEAVLKIRKKLGVDTDLN